MTTVAWTAIGLDAIALVAMVLYLGRKLDNFEAKLTQRIDAVIARTNAGVEVETR